MELIMYGALMVACFGFGWIVGHAVGYETGRNERPRR
jgi:hypothetical protein